MKQSGFTLLEMITVLAMTAILAGMAFNGYSKNLHRADEALAQRHIFELAQQLEKHRSRNFNYAGFATQTVTLPVGATGSRIKYTVNIVDSGSGNPRLNSTSAAGQGYAIRAISSTNEAFSLLYRSDGIKCKNKAEARVTNTSCGTVAQGSTKW